MLRIGALVLWTAVIAGFPAIAAHPVVYLTPPEVERARQRMAEPGPARDTAMAIIKAAAPWLAREDAWYRSVTPPPGAAFAYGFTGCPICGKGWGTWGSARCSFDDPGHVRCQNGHRLPDEAHPDPGTGYVGPDKRIHYFVGSYNAWVVETLTFQAADNLAHAYTLTGDEKYAAKAAVILDALAAVYPSCDKGSWDYPSNPPSGRFNRPWYQVARVLVHYVNQFDQIANSSALDQPSVLPGMTRRENISRNLLENGAEYCFQQSQRGGLNNGEADYLRGALAVGVCLNIPRYIRWAAQGPYGIESLLENNVDRDGAYFETSPSYADHTRSLYFTFSEPLFHLPGAPDLYRWPKLRRFFEAHNLAQKLVGITPPYGDTAPVVRESPPPEKPSDRTDVAFLEKLYARTDDARERADLAALLRWLGPAVADAEHRRWMLFHGRDLPDLAPALPERFRRSILGSYFMGQKGLAILRSDGHGLLLRFGPSLTHGHLDDLNINYVARGYELTYDLGYSLGSTHTQVGWARQTASHNVVVVDEKPQMEGGQTGGSLRLFADLPLVKLAEASSEASYSAQNVSIYRRTVALVGSGSGAYVVDAFHVKGGRQHDWMWHSLGTNVDFDGLSFGPAEKGSLAGADINWAEKQLNDGDMRGYPNKPYWNPPPGNGYGFLASPRRAKPEGGWSAIWNVSDGVKLRIACPPLSGLEVITTVAPGLYPHLPGARYVTLRRQGENLESRFLAVMEAFGEGSSIMKVERIGDFGLKVDRQDGTTDYCSFGDGFAFARFDGGRLQALALVGRDHFSAEGWEARAELGRWRGTIDNLDVTAGMFTTVAPLPARGELEGKMILISNPAYSRASAYRILRVEAQGPLRKVFLDGSVILGKGQVGQVKDKITLTSTIPHEYSRSVRGMDTGFFRGKRIRTETGAAARVAAIKYGAVSTLTVDSSEGFQEGDTFFYEDIQAGDVFEIPNVVYATADGRDGLRIQASTRATVRAPRQAAKRK